MFHRQKMIHYSLPYLPKMPRNTLLNRYNPNISKARKASIPIIIVKMGPIVPSGSR
jgi:hypothetical protein